MPKPIVFIAALLLALSASAQTLMPARQTSAHTNQWGWLAPTAATAQATFDWLDAWGKDVGTILADDWDYLLQPSTAGAVPAQDPLDWIDANWGMDASGWDFLDPERYSYTETDGGEVAVHSFSNQATAQATFDWLDGYLGAAASDFSSYTSRFSSVSNDFRLLEAHMLGGCVSNEDTNVCWSADGSATNAALVRALQYNQDQYRTNFTSINANTWLTTNLFNIVGQLVGLEGTNLTNYAEWQGGFLQMETNFTALPTNLVTQFPSIYQSDVLEPILVEYSNRFAISLDHTAFDVGDNDFVVPSAVERANVTITDYEYGYVSDPAYTGAFDHASGTVLLPTAGWYLFSYRAIYRAPTNGVLTVSLTPHSGTPPYGMIGDRIGLSRLNAPDTGVAHIVVSGSWVKYCDAASRYGLTVMPVGAPIGTNAATDILMRAANLKILKLNDLREADHAIPGLD